MTMNAAAIACRIDHALLLPTMTEAELIAGCELAARYEVATVCIRPSAVPLAVLRLRGSSVGVGTVVGFPHGGNTTLVKLTETQTALDQGATEIDMVVNIGTVRSAQWDHVEREIDQLCRATHAAGGLLKVIFECCYLDDVQKKTLCTICGRVGVDYVKTSTGFGTGGATDPDLKLMRASIPPEVKLKASGGIRDLATAIRFIELGADRLGLSKTSEILDEVAGRSATPHRAESLMQVSPQEIPGTDY